MATCLSVEHLHVQYRGSWLFDATRAVTDVSLTVSSGEVVGLLGPNGAGKSSTFKVVTGLVRPTSGRVELFGRPPRDRRARERLGFLPEEASFHDFLTGEECVDLAARLLSVPASDRRSRVSAVLDRVGLGDARRRRLRTYSKGMKQRVGIAQAIVGRPTLLILDEPMTGLDPIGRREVRDLIQALPAEGVGVVFSTHVLQDVEIACDRVIMLAGGRVVREGRLEDLLGGADGALEVTAHDIAEGPSVALLARFPGHRTRQGTLVFRVASLDAADLLRAAVEAAGGRVASQVPIDRTLEDVFLREVSADPVTASP